MQCSCGADASTKIAKREPANARPAKLLFYECGECGRVSDAVLYVDGVEVAADRGSKIAARDAFNTLTSESANSLYEAALAVTKAIEDARAVDTSNMAPMAIVDDIDGQYAFGF